MRAADVFYRGLCMINITRSMTVYYSLIDRNYAALADMFKQYNVIEIVVSFDES